MMVKFLPELLSFMTDSALKLVHNKLKQDHTNYILSSNFIRYLTSMPAAMNLTCFYALHLTEKKDFKSLSLLLPSISAAYIDSEMDIFTDGFMHSLIIGLASHLGTIRDAILTTIVREFLLPCARHSETCLLYLCRFIWISYNKMKPELVEETINSMQPASDQVKYSTLIILLYVCIIVLFWLDFLTFSLL